MPARNTIYGRGQNLAEGHLTRENPLCFSGTKYSCLDDGSSIKLNLMKPADFHDQPLFLPGTLILLRSSWEAEHREPRRQRLKP